MHDAGCQGLVCLKHDGIGRGYGIWQRFGFNCHVFTISTATISSMSPEQLSLLPRLD